MKTTREFIEIKLLLYFPVDDSKLCFTICVTSTGYKKEQYNLSKIQRDFSNIFSQPITKEYLR